MRRESLNSSLEGLKSSRSDVATWRHIPHSQVLLAYLFLLPTLVGLASVVVYAFLSAIWISLQDKAARLPSKWTWFGNARLAHFVSFTATDGETRRSYAKSHMASTGSTLRGAKAKLSNFVVVIR